MKIHLRAEKLQLQPGFWRQGEVKETFHCRRPVSTWRAWVTAHSSLGLCSSFCTVVVFKELGKDSDRVQDGMSAAVFEVNRTGGSAGPFSSKR